MDRNQAWEIVCEFVKSDSLRKHMLAVEACVAAYARKAGEDEEKWAVAALLHGELTVDHSVELSMRLPAPRLLPTALVAPDRQLVVTPVCSARTLAEGKPPLGIACAQQDLTRVYALADDPGRCVEDFLQQATDHAHQLAVRIEHQEASIERFLELTDPQPEV